MSRLTELVQQAKSIAIIGHVRPDGDDAGACLGVRNYIKSNYPEAEKLKVFLELPPVKFDFLKGYGEINTKLDEDDRDYDLVICLDCATRERLGDFGVLLESAKHSICIDHHITNPGYCEFNDIRAEASSTCEVVYENIDPEKIDLDTAECLYTGIVHDTGVFKYSSTGKRTMEIAGALKSMGVNAEDIIDKSFYLKTFAQLRAWGYAFENAVRTNDGQCVYSIFRWRDMKKFNVSSIELDGISSELRNVENVRFAMLIYQNGEDEFKISMRSVDPVDCSAVAVKYNGGGHACASGCTCTGDPEKIAEMILADIEEQL